MGGVILIDVELYETKDGYCPVEDFIKSLPPKMQAKTTIIIDILEEYGSAIRRPHAAQLRDGIFELRVAQGGNSARILFFFFYKGKAILTNGFIKKTNKVLHSEIERARKYKIEYEERMALEKQDEV